MVIGWTYWLTHFSSLTTSPSSPNPSSSSSKPVPQKPISQKPLVTPCPVCNGQGGWYVDMPCLYRHIHEGWVTCPTCEGKGKVVCRFCEGTGISGGTIEVMRHILGKNCGVGFATAHYWIKQGDLRAPCLGCGDWVYSCLSCDYKKSVPRWFTFAASVVVGVGSTRNFASAQLAMEREKFFTLLRLRQH